MIECILETIEHHYEENISEFHWIRNAVVYLKSFNNSNFSMDVQTFQVHKIDEII